MADEEKKDSVENEVVFEGEDDAANSALQKAKKVLKACEKERKEYLDGWKRTKADALNEKKRQQGILKRERDIALEKCVLVMLPVFDSVRAALSQPSEDTTVHLGVEQIHTQCIQSFSAVGIELIDAVGGLFDPHKHQSVGERNVSSEGEDNTVVEIMRVGACVGDLIIRPAMVYIGVYKKGE